MITLHGKRTEPLNVKAHCKHSVGLFFEKLHTGD